MINKEIIKEKLREYSQERTTSIKQQWLEDNKETLKDDYIQEMQEDYTSYINERWEEEKEQYL